MSYNPKYTITEKIRSNLQEIEALRNTIAGSQILPEAEASVRYRASVESVHSSTSIEGNPLNTNEVRAVLATKKPYTKAEYAEIEVANYKAALDYINTRRHGAREIAHNHALLQLGHPLRILFGNGGRRLLRLLRFFGGGRLDERRFGSERRRAREQIFRSDRRLLDCLRNLSGLSGLSGVSRLRLALRWLLRRGEHIAQMLDERVASVVLEHALHIRPHPCTHLHEQPHLVLLRIFAHRHHPIAEPLQIALRHRALKLADLFLHVVSAHQVGHREHLSMEAVFAAEHRRVVGRRHRRDLHRHSLHVVQHDAPIGGRRGDHGRVELVPQHLRLARGTRRARRRRKEVRSVRRKLRLLLSVRDVADDLSLAHIPQEQLVVAARRRHEARVFGIPHQVQNALRMASEFGQRTGRAAAKIPQLQQGSGIRIDR